MQSQTLEEGRTTSPSVRGKLCQSNKKRKKERLERMVKKSALGFLAAQILPKAGKTQKAETARIMLKVSFARGVEATAMPGLMSGIPLQIKPQMAELQMRFAAFVAVVCVETPLVQLLQAPFQHQLQHQPPWPQVTLRLLLQLVVLLLLQEVSPQPQGPYPRQLSQVLFLARKQGDPYRNRAILAILS